MDMSTAKHIASYLNLLEQTPDYDKSKTLLYISECITKSKVIYDPPILDWSVMPLWANYAVPVFDIWLYFKRKPKFFFEQNNDIETMLFKQLKTREGIAVAVHDIVRDPLTANKYKIISIGKMMLDSGSETAIIFVDNAVKDGTQFVMSYDAFVDKFTMHIKSTVINVELSPIEQLVVDTKKQLLVTDPQLFTTLASVIDQVAKTEAFWHVAKFHQMAQPEETVNGVTLTVESKKLNQVLVNATADEITLTSNIVKKQFATEIYTALADKLTTIACNALSMYDDIVANAATIANCNTAVMSYLTSEQLQQDGRLSYDAELLKWKINNIVIYIDDALEDNIVYLKNDNDSLILGMYQLLMFGEIVLDKVTLEPVASLITRYALHIDETTVADNFARLSF